MTHYVEFKDKVPKHLQGKLEYYPEFLPFALNQVQYTQLWHQLASCKYLYTNGYEIRPTNWLMYQFQWFKGWIGYENHCQPEKISLTLNKLVYFGYTKQFPQPNISLLKGARISSRICVLTLSQYSAETTALFQTELVKSFVHVRPRLKTRYYPKYPFGQRLAELKLFEMIPLLDPIDDNLIEQIISTLDKKQIAANEIGFLRNSKFAQKAAQYYYEKATTGATPSLLSCWSGNDLRPGYFAQALLYDPEIAKRHAQNFIEYHIAQKEYRNVVELLESLANPHLILKFLLTIPENECPNLIQNDRSLVVIMARYYVEKKDYSTAQKFYANIEEFNPHAAFTLAIQQKNYPKAYNIFKQFEATSTFSSAERSTLAHCFFNEVEQGYANNVTDENTEEPSQAESHYLQNLELAKKAYDLRPSKYYLQQVYTFKYYYAAHLINADMNLHALQKADIAKIKKAINLLRECDVVDKELQKSRATTLAKGLMRLIDILHIKITFDYENTVDQEKLQHHLSSFIRLSTELINLLEGAKEPELVVQYNLACELRAKAQDLSQTRVSHLAHAALMCS